MPSSNNSLNNKIIIRFNNKAQLTINDSEYKVNSVKDKADYERSEYKAQLTLNKA